jgi:magnesium-transporting ATPase (P-type)
MSRLASRQMKRKTNGIVRLDWHAVALPVVLANARAGEEGLDPIEARRRLERFGPNLLPQAPPPSWVRIAARQFRSPLIYVLALAGAVSLGIGAAVDAGFIFGILVLNAVIGGFQEWRAEKSSQALRQLLKTYAAVLRDGVVEEVDAEVLVPGDVVWLESGNRVPADLRLLSGQGLEVDESLLTGESLGVRKDAGWSGEPDTPVGDRLNIAYAGSIVGRGRGKGLVVATGGQTLVGQLARDVSSATGGAPPLLIRLERFARVVGVAALAAAIGVAAFGVLVRGYGLGDMFLFAVALAVSAIPEGLPVALTVALAVATTRMARRGVIVRRLAAVEGLGSCTLVASDKTGTLTCNELTVRAIDAGGRRFEVSGQGYAPDGEVLGAAEADRRPLERLARIAALCNEADLHRRGGVWSWRGDPTDVALLAFGHKLGIERERELDAAPEVSQIAFEPERRYAATFHRTGDGGLVCVKGAPERVFDMCAWPDPAERARAASAALQMAAEGFRVLALADAAMARAVDPAGVAPEPAGLAFAGLVGMIDPLRPGVERAVEDCRRAGIQTIMVTGDHPITALAIARSLGLAASSEQVVVGADLSRLSSAELEALVRRARVFARVAPDQKLAIVEAARRAGHFVAVTGDGVNDAPALRAANIGVAMGKSGTDVAREAADLVITDDNFATIVAGVEEGRIAYDNIRKVIYLLVSTGAAEIVLIALALAAGLPLPLLPVQILWLNLVTNGIQDVALAFEPGEPDALTRPARSPDEPIFNRLMVERTLVGALVIGLISFAGFRWMIAVAGWSEAEARNATLLLMVLFENIHLGNCRSETTSLIRTSPLRSPVLLAGALCAFGLHVAAMHAGPAQRVLGTGPLDVIHWLALFGLALTVAVAMELHKWSWRRRHRPAGQLHAPAR